MSTQNIQTKKDIDSSNGFPTFVKNIESLKKLPTMRIPFHVLPEESTSQELENGSAEKVANIHRNHISRIFHLTHKSKPQDHFISLQKWEGIVLHKTKHSFTARLIDLTNEGPDEEAEIPMEEIYEEDKKLLEPGAVFYWNIGYLDEKSGQRKRQSFIRFRRLPVWSQEEIDAAKREAKEIQENIGWK